MNQASRSSSPSFRTFFRASLAAWAILLFAASAHAQFDSAQVSGIIQDQSGAVLPGVDVVLIHAGTNQERHAVTNEAGLYTFPNVPVGTYRIAAALQGFKSISKTGVQVNAGINIRVDVQMEIGALAETVTVEGTSPLTDTSVIGRTVGAEQLAETPLSGRRAAMVAQLSAGVMGGNMGAFGSGLLSFSTNITSINGGRTDEFMMTVDGAPSIRVRAAGGFSMGAQNFDTVEEVQVLTTNYQAEYGRTSAGQLRLVTKSGTREFRGSAFWSYQNEALDANTWSRNRAGLEKSDHRYNGGGFTLGGPIFIPGVFNDNRQKLFFFWGEEWVRDRSVENQTATVPTAAMRRGDFSELLNPRNPFFNAVRIIRHPQTQVPFPNNVIPAEMISPNGQALLNLFPQPTPGFQQGSQNWIDALPVFNNQRKDSIKIDWTVSNNHRLAIRHTWAPNIWNDPEAMGIYSTVWDYPGRTMAATFTSTLSPTFLNEFTFSWGSTAPSRFLGQRTCDYCPGGVDAFLYPQRSQSGLTYPQLFPGTKLDPEKIPDVNLVQGFTAIDNGAYPGSWNDFVFVWSDNVTKISGNHTFKAGGSVERSGMNDAIQLTFAQAPATRNQNGAFRFFDTRPNGTGFSAANTILGLFDDYSEFGDKPNTRWIAMGYDAFLQDSWRATRDLTLELGLRYSLWQPWGAENNELASFNSGFYDPSRAAVIDPRTGHVVSGDRLNGVVLPGDGPTPEAIADFPQLAGLQSLYHGLPSGFSRTFKDGFQPRLGLAYALNDKTTFRTGVGKFLNRVQINTTAAYGFNPPLSEMQTVINGNVDNPAGAETRSFPLVMAMQDPEFRNPQSWTWHATVDRELPGAIRAQLSYVGRSASHLERARNINQLQVGTIQANPGINPNALRPFKGFGSITLYETTGVSRYNGMQVQVTGRPTNSRAGFSVAYTLARTRDDGNGRGDILPNAYDDSGYYGISDFDRTHVFVTQATYRLPLLDGSPAGLRWVFGSWDLSGIFQAQSGIPIDVRTPTDLAGVGPGSGQQFYNVVGDPRSIRTDFDGTRAIWFDRTAFQAPAAGTFGNQAQNTLRLPGFWDFNLSLRKAFPIKGNQRLEFRWVAFNLLNHPRLNDAAIGNNVNNPLSGDFGSITSLTGNRTMQIGLQYLF
jgi:hypothetical protein